MQIDLRFEAQNIERFQKNFKGLQDVKFPTPLRPFVTRTVLVETYEVKMAVLLIVLILYILILFHWEELWLWFMLL